MRTIAVAMAKGGVGKTTTAVSLAGGLATLGKRVLLVDCDTQDQVVRFLGVKPPHGLAEFVTGSCDGSPSPATKPFLGPGTIYGCWRAAFSWWS